ncbi:SusC/RagA family TonB-linked outer membrane protein [Maribacter antarcticus]|uniref:SusC/RagA family TonB-linked outer membrane protein n=1 Tax=Maribacter antarcticus TaxID=505250 RepID=UPI00047AEECC|nr:SusC/RagA family TonB-linked outer membrane protein [Maribacter antarcticus]
MRTKLNGLLTLFLALVVQITFAQDKMVTGTVTDQYGFPLPGVNIIVEGTTNGTQTDFDGNYTITAATGQTLFFTYIGQKNVKQAVGVGSTVNVQMEEDTQALDEVVVTAQGIKREKKALGYAVAEVDQEALEGRSTGDVARVLNGKVAGLQITNQSGLAGSGTNVVIRGLSSFSGSNQALFIVDGVPFNSDTNAVSASSGSTDRNSFLEGNSGSSRFLDLDPNSIESVSVLKGLAAANLYGSLGRNGVILITTKGGSSAGSGPSKSEITVNSSYFFNEISNLPSYQNEFGNGGDQLYQPFFSNFGSSFNRNNVASFENDPGVRNSDQTIPHPFSRFGSQALRDAFPEFQDARLAYRPYRSVEGFFKTGGTATTNVNFRKSSDDGKTAFNLNYGNLDENGFTPGNSLTRNTFGVGGRAELSNKFTVNGTINFARTSFRSPPVAAANGGTAEGSQSSSLFSNLFFTPRSVDLLGQPFQNPLTGGSVYYRTGNDIQNPLWTVANAQVSQRTNRIFGQAQIGYKINDKLNLSYRAGIDFSSEFNTTYQNRGGTDGGARLQSGVLQTFTNDNTIFDHNLVLTGQYDLSEKVGFNVTLGGTTRREIFERNGANSDTQQVFGVLRHFNFANTLPIQFTSERNIAGLYAQLETDYDNWVFLTLAGRNDWVSNFAADNRSIFYPSASISVLPTEVISGLKGNALNYLKLRGGIGTSANFETQSVFPVATVLNLDVQDFADNAGNNLISQQVGQTLGNPNLKPETLREIEVGIESRWWDSRISLDVSLFTRKTSDLIIQQPLDPATGFSRTNTNIGEVTNDGIEVALGVDIFRPNNQGGFNWNSSMNFTALDPVVTDLGQDTEQIIYSGFSNLGNAAIEGEPLGVLFGGRIDRDDDGNLVVDQRGDYATATENGIIGDPNPDFTANFINTVSYKNFTLNWQIAYQQGGDIYSATIGALLGRGVTDDSVDRLGTFILPGNNVTRDGDGNITSSTPNTTQITGFDLVFRNRSGFFGKREAAVYDASHIRLQEVSLAYAMTAKSLERTPFGSVTFTVSGRNLFVDAFNTPDGMNFDPNVNGLGVGNGAGFDFLAGPAARSYGFGIKATF